MMTQEETDEIQVQLQAALRPVVTTLRYIAAAQTVLLLIFAVFSLPFFFN
jgi:hypothetical protein